MLEAGLIGAGKRGPTPDELMRTGTRYLRRRELINRCHRERECSDHPRIIIAFWSSRRMVTSFRVLHPWTRSPPVGAAIAPRKPQSVLAIGLGLPSCCALMHASAAWIWALHVGGGRALCGHFSLGNRAEESE